ATVRRGPRAPLLAVDRAELALVVRPLIPDGHTLLSQPGHVRLATQEPQQLADYRARVNLLGGDERKAPRQVEAHLLAEQRERAGARAIGLACAGVFPPTQQFQILLHWATGVPR